MKKEEVKWKGDDKSIFLDIRVRAHNLTKKEHGTAEVIYNHDYVQYNAHLRDFF